MIKNKNYSDVFAQAAKHKKSEGFYQDAQAIIHLALGKKEVRISLV